MNKESLRITWGVLFVGLKNNWLTSKEVVKHVNNHLLKLAPDEGLVVDLNVNDGDKNAIIELLRAKGEVEEAQAIKDWQYYQLVRIEQSDQTIDKKLKDIELQWSRFGYPESWRAFIYYQPNEKTNSNEGLYQIFLDFLKSIRN